jgi:serine/threonine protein phosphatase PrpC
LKASGLSDVGRVRQNNEDNFFCEPEKNFFIVADGLGGHSAGEIASEMAVTHVASSKPQNIEELVQSITEANAKVHQQAKNSKNDMATTISAMLINQGKAFIAHVGDSRIYLVRDDKTYCITDDHTPVMESLRAGLITEEQARNHPLKHMLSRTIGTHSQVEIDALTIDLVVNDIFVLCTDGLSNLLEEQDIYDIVKSSNTTEELSKNLVAMANHRGGTDNVTVVVVRVEEPDLEVTNVPEDAEEHESTEQPSENQETAVPEAETPEDEPYEEVTNSNSDS